MRNASIDVTLGIAGLRRVAFLLERELAPTYRVKAFRTTAATLAELPVDAVAQRAQRGALTDLPGIGPKTSAVFDECARGGVPAYLAELEGHPAPDPGEGAALMAALRGDLHVHSDWSDGGSPIHEMALTASELGHDYAVLTDHSPTLKVANGLTPERLRQQPRPGAGAARATGRRGRVGAQQAAVAARGDDASDGGGDREPARGRDRSLHRADGGRQSQAPGVGVRGRSRLRGLPTVRCRCRAQLQARAARPAAFSAR